MSEDQSTRGPADDKRPQDLELYAAMLTFTKQRLLHVDRMLDEPPRNRVQLEACALQVRLALEQIVLSTLITNRPGANAVVAAFAKKKAGDVHRLVARINPRYWPVPFDWLSPDGVDSVWRMTEPAEPYLREEEWGRAFGYCSELLHATNPYEYISEAVAPRSAKDTHKAHMDQLKEYSRKMQRLLRRHQIHLSETDHSLICSVPEDPDVRPKVEVWTRAN